MKNRIIKIVSLVLVTSILLSVFTTVCFAEENSDNTVNQTNANILNELLSDIDMDGAYTFNCEYDSNGRIIRILCRSGSVETIYNYTYTGNTYECNVTTNEVAELLSENAELFTSLSGDDLKITNASIKSRIEQAKALWNEANKNGDELTKERAHLEARIARADYCVLYPKSDFAYSFLEDGNTITNTAFRRKLAVGSVGNDVLALQRALMYHGYMDATELLDEMYGEYDSVTKDAVMSFQETKYVGFMVNGVADILTIEKLFSDNISNRDIFVPILSTFNSINLYRTRHNLVRDQVRAQVGAVWYEPYVAGAGLKGNGGFVDVLVISKPYSKAWEIKPKSTYGVKTGKDQLYTYIERSQDAINIDHLERGEYCPIEEGYAIKNITIPYSSSTNIVAYSDSVHPGVVYYENQKNGKPETEVVAVPVPEKAKEHQKEYVRITPPEPKVVLDGAILAGLAVGTFYIVKKAIAVLILGSTGGLSFILFAL